MAFLLIRRSLTTAVFELLGDSASQLSDIAAADAEALVDSLDLSEDIIVDQKLLDRPGDLSIVDSFKTLLSTWLKGLGIEEPAADAIAARLPTYFIYALNQEWRRNSKTYGPLLEALNTPFSKAGDREWAWAEYSALLERRIHEPVFDEPFSLSQLFVPLSAYYSKERPRSEMDVDALRDQRQKRRHVVIDLQQELERWVDGADSQDAIRVISGGPGSGKSSFARVFASSLAQSHPRIKVLFVSLHLIDASKDLVEEVGRFVRDEGVLQGNPLAPESPEPNLLVIFDGLDELASQGKAAADIARAFVREVERTVERRNQQLVRLRVLLSGRELVVQENESEFQRPRQSLNLLPYFTPLSAKYKNDVVVHDGVQHEDPTKLLQRHGDGRTTTVREIEEHCKASGVGRMLDDFQGGAKAGVTRLLAAFFFRSQPQRREPYRCEPRKGQPYRYQLRRNKSTRGKGR